MCRKCGSELPLNNEYFYSRKESKDGFRASCKKCEDKIKKQRIEYIKNNGKGSFKRQYEKNLDKGTKTCSKCKIEFPMTTKYFGIRKSSKDGFKSYCKKCENEYIESHKNPNIKSRPKPFYKDKQLVKVCIKCGEVLPVTSEYFWENKKCKNGFMNVCKKCKSQYTKQYKTNNKEKNSESCKKYYYENREKIRKRLKEYRKKHPEVYNNNNQIRRARELQLPSTLTLEQWEQIKQYFNNKCAYCGRELPLFREHFIALSKGGEYSKNNIVPSCRSCNSSKRDKDFFKWYPKHKFYSKTREQNILKFLNYKGNNQQLKII
jgi:hypothetical protein